METVTDLCIICGDKTPGALVNVWDDGAVTCVDKDACRGREREENENSPSAIAYRNEMYARWWIAKQRMDAENIPVPW